MRWEPNPLYKGPAAAWSRPLILGWIALMVGIEAWLLIDHRYIYAAVFGALAIVGVVFELRRDWNRSADATPKSET
jgi:hypothetical protein